MLYGLGSRECSFWLLYLSGKAEGHGDNDHIPLPGCMPKNLEGSSESANVDSHCANWGWSLRVLGVHTSVIFS
jgi:hypothetical protein